MQPMEQNQSTLSATRAIAGNFINFARLHPFFSGVALGALWQSLRARKAKKRSDKMISQVVYTKKCDSHGDMFLPTALEISKAFEKDPFAHQASAKERWKHETKAKPGRHILSGAPDLPGTPGTASSQMVGDPFTGERYGPGIHVVPPGVKGFLRHAGRTMAFEAQKAGAQRFLANYLSNRKEAMEEERRRESARPIPSQETKGPQGILNRIIGGIKSGAVTFGGAVASLPGKAWKTTTHPVTTAKLTARAISSTIRPVGAAAKDAHRAVIAGLAVGAGKAVQDKLNRIPALSFVRVGVDPNVFESSLAYTLARAKGQDFAHATEISQKVLERAMNNPYLQTVHPGLSEDLMIQGIGALKSYPGAIGGLEPEYQYTGEVKPPSFVGHKAAVMLPHEAAQLGEIYSRGGEVPIGLTEARVGGSQSARRALEEARSEQAKAQLTATPGGRKLIEVGNKIADIRESKKWKMAEREVTRLRTNYERGRIPQEEYKAKLAEHATVLKPLVDKLTELENRRTELQREPVAPRPAWVPPSVGVGKKPPSKYVPIELPKIKGMAKPKKKKGRWGHRSHKEGLETADYSGIGTALKTAGKYVKPAFKTAMIAGDISLGYGAHKWLENRRQRKLRPPEDYAGLGLALKYGPAAAKLAWKAGKFAIGPAAVGTFAAAEAASALKRRKQLRNQGYVQVRTDQDGKETTRKSLISVDRRGGPLSPIVAKQIASTPVQGLLTVRQDLQGGRKRKKKHKNTKKREPYHSLDPHDKGDDGW